MSHSETVGEIYAAFQRGDIKAILLHLADDVEWEYAIEPLGVPWLERRRGRTEVPGSLRPCRRSSCIDSSLSDFSRTDPWWLC